MKPRQITIIFACLALILCACSQEAPAAWSGPELAQSRDQLTVEQLQADTVLPLIDMSYFAAPEWAGVARQKFSGVIVFHDTTMLSPRERALYPTEGLFPGFRAEFISHDGELIPVQRGIIFTSENSTSFWDVMLGVGRVWQEAEDGDWSRASFPISLTDRYMGQVRNCVASFLYQADLMTNVYVQCSQETADLLDNSLGDIRVMLDVEYEPQPIADAAEIIGGHEQYEARRLPVFPLSDIDSDHQIGDYFDKSLVTNASTSLGALVVDDAIYLHPPMTRHGLYPYPEEMHHGVWSVTKSMAGALSMLYFAERYGDQIFDAQITDYVPALANHPGWLGVTFGDTLNMATGTEGSESAEHLLNILVLARSADEAIRNIASLGDYPEGPGEAYNYASTDFFVLSYALQNYVEEQEGESVAYWDLVHDNVLVPIGAEYFTVRHTIESDGSAGIPILAYGAVPTLDEAAKITRLMANEGNYNGQQILHRQKTQEALGRTDWPGYVTDERGVNYRYSFRSTSFRVPGCRIDVSFMLGFGANHVLFLPSDVIVIRFMDEMDFDIETLVRSVEEQISSCP